MTCKCHYWRKWLLGNVAKARWCDSSQTNLHGDTLETRNFKEMLLLSWLCNLLFIFVLAVSNLNWSWCYITVCFILADGLIHKMCNHNTVLHLSLSQSQTIILFRKLFQKHKDVIFRIKNKDLIILIECSELAKLIEA